MVGTTNGGGRRRGRAVWGLRLAILAVIFLAIAGPLARYVHWMLGLAFIPLSVLTAAVAVVFALVALFRMQPGRLGAVAALVVGVVVVVVPLHFMLGAGSAPVIHDISTDTDNPPEFQMVKAARDKEQSNSTDFDPKTVAPQKAAFPDLVPVKTNLSQQDAFQRALDTAQAMPGWTVVGSDPGAGHIEASQSTKWMGFTDDVVIRVAPDGDGAVIDVRSESRHGGGDLGVNAKRIRSYLDALRAKLA